MQATADVRRRQRILVLAIVVLSLFTGVVSALIFGVIQDQFERSEAAVSDNRTWVISQLEVDLLKYTLALEQALRGSPENLGAVRRQYDILFSRVELIAKSPSSADLRLQDGAAWAGLTGPNGLLQRTLPLIDGPDLDLSVALPNLLQEALASVEPIREAVVDSVNATMGISDSRRHDVRTALRLFGVTVLWLSFCLGVLLLLLFLMGRQQSRHAQLLEVSVQTLRTMLDSTLDAVMLIDKNGRIVGANQSCKIILSGLPVEKQPLLSSVLLDPENPGRALPFERLEPGKRMRLPARRSDGEHFPAEISVATAQTAGGQAIAVVFLRDISDLVAHEEKLAAARKAAEQADEAKARFLAVISHEMRTPLNGVISAGDLLARTGHMTAEQSWFVDIIRSCGQTALEQVNNVLQMTRLGSRDVQKFPTAAFSLPQALKALVNQFAADATRQGTELRVVGDLTPDFAIECQQQPLRRALSNLLSNAVKFTEGGTITLRLEKVDHITHGRVALRISLEDTGIGIAEDNLERIFNNFETLDASFSRVREGSGLGLGIAKLSAEALGGRIEAESQPGKGSRFTLIFDVPIIELPEEIQSRARQETPRMKALSVLLAEDNHVNRMLMRRQLEELGLVVTEACDGAEAVRLARQTRFDTILMDLSMPRLDGLTAAGLIRADRLQPDVPIIAVTAQVSSDRVQQLAVAGITDVLTKPASVDEIAAMITAHCNATGSTASDWKEQARPEFAHRDGGEALADDVRLAELTVETGSEFLRTMVGQFETDTKAALQQIETTLADADLYGVGRLAHRAAGGAAVLGLTALYEAFCALELAAQEHDVQTAGELVSTTETLFTRSAAHLHRTLDLL